MRIRLQPGFRRMWRVFHLRFSTVKNGFDLSMVAISAGLCLFHHCPFYGIGVSTVLSVLLLGRVIKLFELLPLSGA